MQGHCAEVWCVAISHDGDTIVSFSGYVTSVHVAEPHGLLCHVQATGSHDLSFRLWERTEEPLILSEERERVGFLTTTTLHCCSTFSPSLPPIWLGKRSEV